MKRRPAEHKGIAERLDRVAAQLDGKLPGLAIDVRLGADSIRSLLRSLARSGQVNSRLWRDNRELHKRGGGG